jgi:hypothetical protein
MAARMGRSGSLIVLVHFARADPQTMAVSEIQLPNAARMGRAVSPVISMADRFFGNGMPIAAPQKAFSVACRWRTRAWFGR